MRLRYRSSRRWRRRKGAALYLSVVYTALLVSLLGLAGLTLVRIERQQAARSAALAAARQNARSAVELALTVINSNPHWRTTYVSGQETASQTLGPQGRGALSWILLDSDGSLTDADTALRLRGVGRLGGVVQVSSVGVTTAGVERAEELLLQQDSLNSGVAAEVNLKEDVRLAQSFRPALPPEATSWRITRVAFLPRPHSGTDGQLAVSVRAMGSDGKPSSSAIDQVIALESDFVADTWYEAAFSNAGGLDPTKEYCIVLHAVSGAGTIALVKVGDLSLLSPETRYFFGDPDGKESEDGEESWTEDSTKDLWIKVWGAYTDPDGVEAQVGQWRWDSAP